ncbi:MAG: cupin domain-containing protein [Candidatus Latescibacteria bacterium]|nr:cupin domain-containing protein [bacterium]MBD3423133.1 cupin domain-containing protein [Candidatus Latescibacterota bacterium]
MKNNEVIGERLKKYRLQKGMTLKKVERKASVSATHISEIERGMTSPTIGALSKLAGAIDVDLARIVRQEEYAPFSIVGEKEKKKMKFEEWGASYFSLIKDMARPQFSFLEVELAPGVKRPEETSTHAGEEFALVTKGVMEIIIGSEKYILKEGDSIHYRADQPHAMRNIGGVACRAIWITFPPYTL